MSTLNDVMTDLLIEQEGRIQSSNHGKVGNFVIFALKAERTINEDNSNENQN